MTATAPRQNIESRPGLVVEGDALPEVRAASVRSAVGAPSTRVPLRARGDSVSSSGSPRSRNRRVSRSRCGAYPTTRPSSRTPLSAAVHLDGSLTLIHQRAAVVRRAFGGPVRCAAARRGGAARGPRAPRDRGARSVGVGHEVGAGPWPHELVGEQLDADLLAVGGHRARPWTRRPGAPRPPSAPRAVPRSSREPGRRGTRRGRTSAWAREPSDPAAPRLRASGPARPARAESSPVGSGGSGSDQET